MFAPPTGSPERALDASNIALETLLEARPHHSLRIRLPSALSRRRATHAVLKGSGNSFERARAKKALRVPQITALPRPAPKVAKTLQIA